MKTKRWAAAAIRHVVAASLVLFASWTPKNCHQHGCVVPNAVFGRNYITNPITRTTAQHNSLWRIPSSAALRNILGVYLDRRLICFFVWLLMTSSWSQFLAWIFYPCKLSNLPRKVNKLLHISHWNILHIKTIFLQ